MSSALYSAAPFKVVSMLDPALDLEAMGKDTIWQYVADRNFDLLKFKHGVAPMVYYVRKLPESAALNISSSAANDEIKYLTAFSVCTVRVEGILTDEALPRETFVPKWQSDGGSGMSEIMRNEEAARFPLDERREIGEVAYKRSFLRLGRKLSLLPLPSFLTDLASRAQFSRLADAQAHHIKPTDADTELSAASQYAEDGDATETVSAGETSTPT